MKEVTRIVNVQITIIEKVPDKDVDTIISSKEDTEINVKNTMQQLYNVDDVQVEIKDFVMD